VKKGPTCEYGVTHVTVKTNMSMLSQTFITHVNVEWDTWMYIETCNVNSNKWKMVQHVNMESHMWVWRQTC